MKKRLLIVCVVLALLLSGCSLKIQRDSFFIPQDKVESLEFQREYKAEDGESYYCKKEVTEAKDMVEICDMIRSFPGKKASSDEPNPIEEIPLIIILHGQKDHKLILNEKMAFYDHVAYEYTEEGVFERFMALYNNLGYSEEKTEPDFY